MSVRARRRALVGAYVADGLLEWATSIALLVWSYDRTGSALAAGALLIAKQAVPGLAAPLVGRVLDRRGARGPLSAGLGLRAAGTALALIVARPEALLPLAALAGIGGMMVRASLRTVAATSFDGEARRTTNAATNTAMGITSMAGPAVGGAAVVATSPLLVGLSAALVGLFIAIVVVAQSATTRALAGAASPTRSPQAAAADASSVGAPSTPRRRSRRRLAMLAAIAAIAALLAMDEPALLPYAGTALGGDAGSYGLILAAWGAGIIVGSLWLTRLTSHSMLTVAAWGAALVAAAYLGLAAAPSVAVATTVAVAGGIGNGLDWMALVTALQERTPAAEQGRLAADLEAVIAFGPPVGYLTGGTLADAAGARAPFLVGGLASLAVLAAAVAAYAAMSRGRAESLAAADAAPEPA